MLDEGQVVALIEEVCRAERRRPPSSIVFHRGPHAHVTYGAGGSICLPTLSYTKKFKLLDGRTNHVLLVLHEITHWLVGKDAGHKPEPFYTTLYRLAEERGLDMGVVYEDELNYKPRYAKKGWWLYRQFITKENPPA